MNITASNLFSLPDEIIQEIALSLSGVEIKELLSIPLFFQSLRPIIRYHLPKNKLRFEIMPNINRESCKEIHWRKRMSKKYIYCLELHTAKELRTPYFKTRLPLLYLSCCIICLNFNWDHEDRFHLGDRHKSRAIQTQFNRSHIAELLKQIPTGVSVFLNNRGSNGLNLDLDFTSFFTDKSLIFQDRERKVYILGDIKDLKLTADEGEEQFFANLFKFVNRISLMEISINSKNWLCLKLEDKVESLIYESLGEPDLKKVEKEAIKRRKVNSDSLYDCSPLYDFSSVDFQNHNFSLLVSLRVKTLTNGLTNLRLESCLSLELEVSSSDGITESEELLILSRIEAPELVMLRITIPNADYLIDFQDVKFANLQTLIYDMKHPELPTRKNKSYSQATNLFNVPNLKCLKATNIHQLLSLNCSIIKSLCQVELPVCDNDDLEGLESYSIESSWKSLTLHAGNEITETKIVQLQKRLNMEHFQSFHITASCTHLNSIHPSQNYHYLPYDIESFIYYPLIRHWMQTWMKKYDDSHRMKSQMDVVDYKRDLLERFAIKPFRFPAIVG